MKTRLALLLLLLAPLLLLSRPAEADEGWVITAFDASYVIRQDGSVEVVEDIRVDFGTLQKHGILRDIPVEYDYDDNYTREIPVRVLSVDDGSRDVRYQTTRNGAVLTIRIGDPDRFVSGQQRYRITYSLTAALNSQDTWDEFYWNVTGNQWPVRILSASATVSAPAIESVICFEGRLGSSDPCNSQPGATTARFVLTAPQPEGGGLTVAVALPKGSVAVPPPILIEIKSWQEQVSDFVGLKPAPIIAAILVGIASLFGVVRYWWLSGRDHWLGDVQYLTGNQEAIPRPLFAKDTVVVEYQPPTLGREKRRLGPAEIGTLMDERADTLDVTATIVDLAVRGYLRITEIPKSGLFGKADYQLERLKHPDEALLPYEKRLLEGLFETGGEVKMSELKNKFYTDLSEVKSLLYDQVVKTDKLFSNNPETVRILHYVGGAMLIGAALAAGFVLGQLLGAAIIGIPIGLAGLLMLLLAGAMPRRTGAGRELYRRCLGFRKYMTVAETDRQRSNEEIGLFQEYLPYAIVFQCVDKWAKAFEGLDTQAQVSSWYVGSGAFTASAFSSNLQSFSSSISTSIASTPGGSGGSGFSGGGSGGGGGGGGGGSW